MSEISSHQESGNDTQSLATEVKTSFELLIAAEERRKEAKDDVYAAQRRTYRAILSYAKSVKPENLGRALMAVIGRRKSMVYRCINAAMMAERAGCLTLAADDDKNDEFSFERSFLPTNSVLAEMNRVFVDEALDPEGILRERFIDMIKAGGPIPPKRAIERLIAGDVTEVINSLDVPAEVRTAVMLKMLEKFAVHSTDCAQTLASVRKKLRNGEPVKVRLPGIVILGTEEKAVPKVGHREWGKRRKPAQISDTVLEF